MCIIQADFISSMRTTFLGDMLKKKKKRIKESFHTVEMCTWRLDKWAPLCYHFRKILGKGQTCSRVWYITNHSYKSYIRFRTFEYFSIVKEKDWGGIDFSLSDRKKNLTVRIRSKSISNGWRLTRIWFQLDLTEHLLHESNWVEFRIEILFKSNLLKWKEMK